MNGQDSIRKIITTRIYWCIIKHFRISINYPLSLSLDEQQQKRWVYQLNGLSSRGCDTLLAGQWMASECVVAPPFALPRQLKWIINGTWSLGEETRETKRSGTVFVTWYHRNNPIGAELNSTLRTNIVDRVCSGRNAIWRLVGGSAEETGRVPLFSRRQGFWITNGKSFILLSEVGGGWAVVVNWEKRGRRTELCNATTTTVQRKCNSKGSFSGILSAEFMYSLYLNILQEMNDC